LKNNWKDDRKNFNRGKTPPIYPHRNPVKNMSFTDQSFNDYKEKSSGQAQPTVSKIKHLSQVQPNGKTLHRSKPLSLSPVEPCFVFYRCINTKIYLSLQKI
jgi:hypothetical protein